MTAAAGLGVALIAAGILSAVAAVEHARQARHTPPEAHARFEPRRRP